MSIQEAFGLATNPQLKRALACKKGHRLTQGVCQKPEGKNGESKSKSKCKQCKAKIAPGSDVLECRECKKPTMVCGSCVTKMVSQNEAAFRQAAKSGSAGSRGSSEK